MQEKDKQLIDEWENIETKLDFMDKQIAALERVVTGLKNERDKTAFRLDEIETEWAANHNCRCGLYNDSSCSHEYDRQGN